MKIAAAVVAVLLLGSAGAQAGIFSSNKDKLPKPIDHPIVRPKLREDHKVGKKGGRHAAEMLRPEYGGVAPDAEHHESPPDPELPLPGGVAPPAPRSGSASADGIQR